MVYRFDDFLVNSQEYILLKGGEQVHLSPKSFEVLHLLLVHHGRLVSKDEIMEEVWKDTAVEVGRLASCVQEIRTALGDHARAPRWIETVHKRGYRFIGAVLERAEEEAAVMAGDSPEGFGDGLQRMPGMTADAVLSGIAGTGSRTQRPPERRNLLPWIAALTLAVGGALMTIALLRQNRPQPPLLIVASRQLTHTSHAKLSFAVAPGASTAWFSEQHGHLQAWRLALATGAAKKFFTDSAANVLVQDVSHDGNRLLVTRFANLSQQPSTSLWEIPTEGHAPPRQLVSNGWSGAWSPGGKRIAYSLWGDHGIYVAGADGGHPHRVAAVPGYPWDLHWSAGGHRLVFISVDALSLDTLSPSGNLYVMDLGEGKVTQMRDAAGQVVRAADPLFAWNNHTVAYTRNEAGVANVWQINLRTGREQAITSGPSNTRLVSIGPGANELVTAGEIPHTRLVELDGAGATPKTVLGGLETRDLAFSPDGKWVAYAGLDGSLWRARADGAEPVQLLGARWNASLPVWSPDSRQLIISAAPQGGAEKLYLVAAAGTGLHAHPQALTAGPGNDADANWSADQRHVLFSRTIAGVPQLEWLNVATGKVVAVSDSRGKASPRLSREGILSAVSANGDTLYLRRGLNAPWKPILTDRSGLGYNLWSREGKSLYVLTQTPTATWKRYDLATGTVTAVDDLSTLSIANGPWYCLALTAHDNLVVVESSNDSELFLLTLARRP